MSFMSTDNTTTTILIVDDDAGVLRSVRDALDQAQLGCRLLTAGDDVQALEQAGRHMIDLAILDWNLGTGIDGLQLLGYLREDYNPDIVAILMTAFAAKATPLDAMRNGVRDYLEKPRDLNREELLRRVRPQLEHVQRLKRERSINQGLRLFRDAVEKVVPLIQNAATLHDPVPLPTAIHGLFLFLQRTTGATSGALLVRSFDPHRQQAELCRAYDIKGQALTSPLVDYSRSLASSVVSMQEPHVLADLRAVQGQGVELQPFEQGRKNLLAVPLNVASGVQVVLELFDKEPSFTEMDRNLARAAADLGADLLRQALAERHMYSVLYDAVAAALKTSEAVTEQLSTARSDPPPTQALAQLRESLERSPANGLDAAATVRLAEAIRELAVRHGSRALDHCTQLVENLRSLLDHVGGMEEAES